MKKERLALVMDVALVVAMGSIFYEMGFPWPVDWPTIWESRGEYFRRLASALWVVSLWLGLYAAWDRAERVSAPAVLLGAAQVLCALAVPWVTRLIVRHPKAWLAQAIYGTVILASAAVDYLLLLALERANADVPSCGEAARRWRRVLLGAMGILAVGLTLAMIKFRFAMRCSVALAGVYLLALWIASWAGKEKNSTV